MKYFIGESYETEMGLPHFVSETAPLIFRANRLGSPHSCLILVTVNQKVMRLFDFNHPEVWKAGKSEGTA